MDPRILQDDFLVERDISLEKSSFLSQHYAHKSLGMKMANDPRDPFGQRLDSIWKKGDSVGSVILKRMQSNLWGLLNPDTYSHEFMREKSKNIQKNKMNYIGFLVVVMFPIVMVGPLLRPRFMKAKRDFLFQYYVQSQTISQKLRTGNEKLSVSEMERIIKNAQDRVRL